MCLSHFQALGTIFAPIRLPHSTFILVVCLVLLRLVMLFSIAFLAGMLFSEGKLRNSGSEGQRGWGRS